MLENNDSDILMSAERCSQILECSDCVCGKSKDIQRFKDAAELYRNVLRSAISLADAYRITLKVVDAAKETLDQVNCDIRKSQKQAVINKCISEQLSTEECHILSEERKSVADLVMSFEKVRALD